MTLIYKLLGLPGNLEEAIEKSKEIKSIPNITIKRKLGNSLVPEEIPCKCLVNVKVGNFNLNLWESGEFVLKRAYPRKGFLYPQDCYAIKKAHEIVDNFSSEGLVIRINGDFYNLKNQ